MKNSILLSILLLVNTLCAFTQNISQKTGGGNMNNGLLDAANIERISLLEATGAKMTRINLYPNDYWDFTNNVPKTDYMDALILQLAQKDIHVILLFEHYEYFPGLGYPLGNYSKWYQIGSAFANKYQPGSSFFVSNGYPNYGVEYFTAINEPDLGASMPKTSAESPENYHDAIEGLADGVHSVDSSLKVIPGGFASENTTSNHTLNGFGTAITDLFNNGKLYGIDLHTYNDVSYAPILKYDNTNHVQFMAFYDFQEVKTACGITADIKFCPTEFSFKENEQGINAQLAAKRLLTCIWGNLGAVLNDSSSSATEYALVWNLYNSVLTEDPVYGMCWTRNPYNPTEKGQTYNLVLELAHDLHFTHLDPFQKGEFTLEGNNKKMWVFQNYPLLSSIYGTSYILDSIPPNCTEIQVYNWNGLINTIPNQNYSSYAVSDLNVNETYMFVAVLDSINTIGESTAPESINPYPNPSNSFFTISNKQQKIHQIEVMDVYGNCVEKTQQNSDFQSIEIGQNYPKGVYFLTIYFDSSARFVKLIKN